MRRHRLTVLPFALALFVAIATPSAAADRGTDAPPKPVPEALRPAVSEAEAWGTRIYLHDRAAWLVTDALFETRKGKALLPRLGGWVTEDTADGVRVIFVSNDATPVRLYEQEMRRDERLGKGVFESPEPLTAEHLAQARARATAGDARLSPLCAAKHNVVSLRDGEAWRVYVMPAFQASGVYPAGGYHRVDVSADGNTVLKQRTFTRGCIDLQDANDTPDAQGRRMVGAMVTHLLDPSPTEVHVFLSRHMRAPLKVVTSGEPSRLWSVTAGKVHFVDDIGGKDSD